MHVLIANNNAAVRSRIRGLIGDAIPGTTFAEAADSGQTLALLAKQEVSVVLLDIRTRGFNGIELLRAIKRLYSGLPVILLGDQPEKEYAQPCMKAGAASYINLDNAFERLAREIAKVNERESSD